MARLTARLGERTDLSNPALGDAQRETFASTAQVLRKIGIIDASVDLPGTLSAWVDGSYL